VQASPVLKYQIEVITARQNGIETKKINLTLTARDLKEFRLHSKMRFRILSQ
jgi:hypothetical protein